MALFPQALRNLIFLTNVEDALVPKDENAVVEPSQDVVVTAARPIVHRDSGRVENVTQHEVDSCLGQTALDVPEARRQLASTNIARLIHDYNVRAIAND